MIIYISLLSEIYQSVYFILRNFFLKDLFDEVDNKVIPLFDTSVILYGVKLLFILLQILFNLLAFFFVIKNSYKMRRKIKEEFSNESFIRISHMHNNEAIDDFLKGNLIIPNQNKVDTTLKVDHSDQLDLKWKD